MNFLSQCLGVLLAWFVVLSVFYVIRFFIKSFVHVDIINQDEIDEAKDKIKNKIASSKTAETIAGYIAGDLRKHSEFERNIYFNDCPNESENDE